MKYWISLIVLSSLLLAACGTQPAETPDQEFIPQVSIENSAEGNTIMAQPDQAGAIQLTDGALTFTIHSPVDNAVVTTSTVELRGTTNTETVLTIDGLLCLLTAGKEFSYPVELEEGYNTIELVASDYEGNQVEMILTIIYES